jgi:hypothetical protein
MDVAVYKKKPDPEGTARRPEMRRFSNLPDLRNLRSKNKGHHLRISQMSETKIQVGAQLLLQLTRKADLNQASRC